MQKNTLDLVEVPCSIPLSGQVWKTGLQTKSISSGQIANEGTYLYFVFSLLLAGDIHQWPGPLSSSKVETETPTVSKHTTTGVYSVLQVETKHHVDHVGLGC